MTPTEIAALKQDKRPQSSTLVHALIDRLETAEKDIALKERVIDALGSELNALHAKIKAMEQQKPVAWGAFYFGGKLNGKLYSQCDTEAQIDMYIADRHQSDDSNTFRKAPLYALPGAHPAPSALDVDALAQIIREVDGKRQLCAGALAERIVEWLAEAPEAKP